MTKTFCTNCGEELADNKNVKYKAIQGSSGAVKFKIEATINGEPDDICETCVFQAVERFDPRPKAATV